MHPHPNPEGQIVNGQLVEAMLVDKPFIHGPGTPHLIKECWTLATGAYTGNPDSTTGRSPAQDTTERPDAQDPLTHVTASQTYNGDLISSSYSDVILEIGGENVVVKGTWRTELINAHIVNMGNNRFRCNYCEFISHNRVNTFAHIGYIHLSSPYEACSNMCFQTFFMQE